jgi:hypothetical protein
VRAAYFYFGAALASPSRWNHLPAWTRTLRITDAVTDVTDTPPTGADTLVRRMKRFIQIVALAVVALLAAQPALANASCLQQDCGNDSSASDCCMHAGGMAMAGLPRDGAMASMGATCQSVW